MIELLRIKDLALIAVNTGRDAPLPREAEPAPAAAAPVRPPENKVIHSPVRSGQMIVAEHGDLTVIGSVASGAELIAAGNIHVYGTLRGRAMAGCHGDEHARPPGFAGREQGAQDLIGLAHARATVASICPCGSSVGTKTSLSFVSPNGLRSRSRQCLFGAARWICAISGHAASAASPI